MKSIPKSFGQGGIGGASGFAADAIKALLAPKVSVVDGAAANTAITVAGMTKAAVVLSAVAYNAGVPSATTATVQADGTVKLAADTTGAKVVLTWLA